MKAYAQKSVPRKIGFVASRVAIYLLLTAGALLMVFPYFWMILSSFKTASEVQALKITIFPEVWMWSNYKQLFDYVPFFRGVLNTLVIEVSVIVVGTFVSTLAAFSFAKLKLRGKTFWLLLLMSSMMVPYAALMMPQFRVFQALKWTDTPLPLIIPGLFGNISLMFFLIQYMKGIPSAFFEAAKIDGAGYFTQFISIMVPLCKTAISAQIIFWFIGIWNDYFGPSIYLTKYESMTLQPMIARLNSENSDRNMPLIFAGSFIASIPMIVIYIGFQKYFVESLAISGVKG